MNQTVKTFITITALIVVIGGASVTYSVLSEDYKDKLTGIEKVTSQVITGTSAENNRIAAPDFNVLDSEGNSVSLSSLFGKTIVLNFWASWCPPCKAEMPDFNKVYQEMKDDVVFVMVDMIDGQIETLKSGKAFIEKQGYVFPVYYDTNQEAAIAYGISSIPTTVIIDANGMAVFGFQGTVSEQTLRNAIIEAKIIS
jgi:thiol-disulfide isomerase/thioredoxin